MSKAWPFGDDADKKDPLTKLRIAVAGPYAEWCYLVSFDPDSKLRPTDQEAALLASYLEEYKTQWYNERYIAHMAEKPLDVDGGANGVTFHKYGENDWGYRRRTWRMGPQWVPNGPHIKDRTVGPMSLLSLMDHIHTVVGEMTPRWVEWKKNHTDIFGD